MAHASFVAAYLEPFVMEWPVLELVAPDVTPVAQAPALELVAPNVGIPLFIMDEPGELVVGGNDVAVVPTIQGLPDARRVQVWGPHYVTDDQWIPFLNLRVGDKVVFATSSVGYNYTYGLVFDGSGQQWYSDPRNEYGLGVIHIIGSGLAQAKVQVLVEGDPVVAAAVVYRGVDSVEIEVGEPGTAGTGTFPSVDFTSPDGRVTAVRPITWRGSLDPGGIDVGDGGVVVTADLPGDDPNLWSANISISEELDVQGPPIPESGYAVSNPFDDFSVFTMTVALVNNFIPEETPDANPAPVGTSVMPVDVD